VPAQYATVTKQVVKTPASYKEEEIPAQYSTVAKRSVSAPQNIRETAIPAEYATVTKRRLVKAGGFSEWREVLCGDKVTEATVRAIQAALSARGYDPGPSDNVMGARTKAAMVKFQQDKGLPVGNMNIETLKALGVQ
jgi:peptidoglycan hydrolase-like protein with peptidoglycan-binding domain